MRRSLFGWNLVCINWEDTKLIQGFPVRRQRNIEVGGYRVLSKNNFFLYGVVFFADENDEILASKLNLIARKFAIPMEQRRDKFEKFEKVDALDFL